MAKILENPRASCILGGAFATLLAIERVTPILHSGPGCSQMTHLGQINQGGFKTESYMVSPPCSVMLEKEIVFGGTERLRETIKGALEIFDADLFFVLTGCTAGIIGDDVQSVVAEFQNEKQPVIFADTAGFKGDTYAGYETALNTLLQTFASEPSPKKEPLTVNIFGLVPYQDLYWQGTLNEIKRILSRLGVKAHTFFGVQQRIHSFREAAHAGLNLIFSPWLATETEEFFRERHGIPSLRFDSYPIGPTATTKFVRLVGEALALDSALVEAVILDEEEYVYSFLATIAGTFSQNQFALIGDANTVIATMKFLVNDYGQIPIVAIVTDQLESEPARQAIANAVTDLEYERLPAVVFAADQWQIKEEIRARAADLTQLYGSALDREIAAELGLNYVNHSFPTSEKLIFDKSYAGYKGCLRLLEDVLSKK
jgi:nitrogenase molybdenum-iron protein beta chain